MGDIEKLNNIIGNKDNHSQIYPREILQLQESLDTNKDHQLDENVKEVMQNQANIKILKNGIKKYLDQEDNVSGLSADHLHAYKNILRFLNDSLSSSDDSHQAKNNIDIQKTKEEIDMLLEKLEKLLNIENQKQIHRAEQEKNKKIQEAQEKGQRDFLEGIRQGLTTGKDIRFKDLINSLFIKNQALVVKTLDMFIDNYNSHAQNILTKDNLTEKMYYISAEQKDLFSGYFGELIVAQSKDEKSIMDPLGEVYIPFFRKRIYPLLFRENQEIPLLLSHKRIIVGDKTGTEGIVPGYKQDFGVNLFTYPDQNPESAMTNISWLPGQKTMDISFLASGVDHEGAGIEIRIGSIIIKGKTRGKDGNSTDEINQNLINWSTDLTLPTGLSIEDGSIKIDSKLYGGTPIVNVRITSIMLQDGERKDYDEVMIRELTNGKFEKDGEWGSDKIVERGSFESGNLLINQSLKETFNQEVEGIKEMIRNRLPIGTNLLVKIGAGVDKNPVSPDLTNKLKEEVIALKTQLQGYEYIIEDMETVSKDANIAGEGNKLLAQARLLTGVKYIIDVLGQQPDTNNYLDKIMFQVENIGGSGDQRYFDFEMSKNVVKVGK